MLQDNGHFLRILRLQPRRQPHVAGARIEGDVEVMIARQAVLAASASIVRTAPRKASWMRRS